MLISMMRETDSTKKFMELFSELEYCIEDDQKQKIEEMNTLMNEMDKEEFKFIFSVELFNKIEEMIEEKKVTLENVILLLSCTGYWMELKDIWCYPFKYSLLNKRLEKMIIDENEKKKEEKNKMLLTDLCKFFVLWNHDDVPDEFLSITVPCLLSAASDKEDSKEAKKEVEIALLALSYIFNNDIDKELYLEEIKEIIQYHQEHRNLTTLAYQSAWQFLINRFWKDKSLEEVITNELHFAREATRELEDLSKSVDWKKKEEERVNKTKEVLILIRWLEFDKDYFPYCHSWNEELSGLISRIVQVLRASRDNCKEISRQCINSLREAADKRVVKIDYLLKEGIIVLFFDEIKQSTLDDDILWNCLFFFLNISRRLKEEEDEKEEEEEKTAKRKVFEMMEEEGYEDCVECFNENFHFFEQ
ncbi:uncharacterized protein MONOS_18678 [Monocercomonoides exilis]|uniref:uncharacterized protein n=1 Tax=Monocercomonoides exilis TaxID=2049356 RepID=UPI003559902B|nr:hypothetical protein MONOS_18678 [Monocercomonoides exilis]